jgi:putative transposase
MRPPRLAGFDYVGCHRYFLTVCTFQRTALFTTQDLVAAVWLQFLRTGDEHHFALIAYCFMPDHLHVLAEATSDTADFRRFVAEAKQRGAHAARRWMRGRLWQPGYFDRVLRDDDNSYDVARYIVQNPVRAGLAGSPGEYPFLGSSIFSTNDLIASVQWKP